MEEDEDYSMLVLWELVLGGTPPVVGYYNYIAAEPICPNSFASGQHQDLSVCGIALHRGHLLDCRRGPGALPISRQV